MTEICINCGNEIAANRKRCPYCETPVKELPLGNFDNHNLDESKEIFSDNSVEFTEKRDTICPDCNRKLTLDSKFCSNCGRELKSSTSSEIFLLERIKYLESKINGLENKIPTSSVINQSFLTRAFAIYGHALVAGLIIGVPIYIIIFLIAAMGN